MSENSEKEGGGTPPLLRTSGSPSFGKERAGGEVFRRGGRPELFLATGNPGKIAEFRSLLARHFPQGGWRLRTPRDWPVSLPEVEESGATFAENARLKALALAQATGLPALADDSGLCVDALGGAPGLYSARWAGPDASDADRNAKLLSALENVPPELRTARFVCAAALALPGGAVWTAEGVCEGVLLDAPRGSGGFGYDPLLLIPDLNRTMAELDEGEKNARSHRGLAITRLAPALARFAGASERV